MRKIYRLKHIPTGLYWVKRRYMHLSENGTVFSTGSNSFNGLSPEHTIYLNVTDKKFIQKHLDIFKRVGELKEHPESKWDMKIGEMIPTGKTYFTWHMMSKVSDFEKEYVTINADETEKSTNTNQELVRRVADICWNHRVNPDIETFDEWLNLIQDELKQQ